MAGVSEGRVEEYSCISTCTCTFAGKSLQGERAKSEEQPKHQLKRPRSPNGNTHELRGTIHEFHWGFPRCQAHKTPAKPKDE